MTAATGTSQSGQAGGTRAQDPPVMVAATVGEVTAVWQVEVDARVLLGDFSGAWLVDSDGVQGFAADADWIEGRDDRDTVLSLLLRHPVFLAEGTALDGADGVRTVDVEATVQAVRAGVERNRADFAEANPGKRQPSWGDADDIVFEVTEAHAVPGAALPQGLEGDAATAVVRCMATARAVRGLVRSWNSVEKLRVQRLGGELRALPLVLN
ncbi:MAG: N-acetylglucosamine-6-phosphate deacetylase [Corynebacterium sp.]|nr:N-acetylglucosamine-6-phosphate deacetylase [Corynebacterium sp.]